MSAFALPEDAIDLLGTTTPWQTAPGSGALWFRLNQNMPDGHFDDWGAAVAVKSIINAAPAMAAEIRRLEAALEDIRTCLQIGAGFTASKIVVEAIGPVEPSDNKINREAIGDFLRQQDNNLVLVPRCLLQRILNSAEEDSITAEHHDVFKSTAYQSERQAIRDMRITAGIAAPRIVHSDGLGPSDAT